MVDIAELDYSADAPTVGDNSMKMLSGLAREQKQLEAEVAALQKQLQEKQDELERLAGGRLPEVMAELRLKEFTTDDGVKIVIKESIHTSIPKAKEDEAFKWLEENDQSGLIKRKFVIAFNRDEEGWANKFKADLAKRKKQLNAKIERKVEPMTLRSFVTKELEKGNAIPTELFGVHRRKLATVEVK